MYPKGCFSGNYQPDTSYPKDFNNIIALEFGAPQSPTRPGRVNLAIADYLIANVVNPKLHQTLFVSSSVLLSTKLPDSCPLRCHCIKSLFAFKLTICVLLNPIPPTTNTASSLRHSTHPQSPRSAGYAKCSQLDNFSD